MRATPPVRVPTLAERALELRGLGIPGAHVQLLQGRELRFTFSLSPTSFSRDYRCMLVVTPNHWPRMVVLEPNLYVLADGRVPPHIYRHDGPGTNLCLWLPRKNEWQPQMKLLDTYLAWTAEWLNYFEEWLATGQWVGGGEHPPTRKKRRFSGSRIAPSRDRSPTTIPQDDPGIEMAPWQLASGESFSMNPSSQTSQ